MKMDFRAKQDTQSANLRRRQVRDGVEGEKEAEPSRVIRSLMDYQVCGVIIHSESGYNILELEKIP